MAATEPVSGLPAPTRDRLLDAAVEVFRTHGYEGARVQDIARRAGLTTGAIYANFRGKADLLAEAMGRRARAEVDELLHDETRAPREVLHILGVRLSAPRTEDERPLLVDAIVAAQRDPELAALVHDALHEREVALTALVGAAQRDGTVDPALDTDTLTRYCLMLALGAMVVRSAGLDAADPRRWDALVARLLDAFTPSPEGNP
jgi:AcrR family transcriptional regulator